MSSCGPFENSTINVSAELGSKGSPILKYNVSGPLKSILIDGNATLMWPLEPIGSMWPPVGWSAGHVLRTMTEGVPNKTLGG